MAAMLSIEFRPSISTILFLFFPRSANSTNLPSKSSSSDYQISTTVIPPYNKPSSKILIIQISKLTLPWWKVETTP